MTLNTRSKRSVHMYIYTSLKVIYLTILSILLRLINSKEVPANNRAYFSSNVSVPYNLVIVGYFVYCCSIPFYTFYCRK